MSGTGYEVDLDYLNATISKLHGVVTGMDEPVKQSAFGTDLKPEQLGSKAFLEAGTLHAAHDEMKTQINAMISTLQSMVLEFTNKTTAVHAAYTEQETVTGGHFKAS